MLDCHNWGPEQPGSEHSKSPDTERNSLVCVIKNRNTHVFRNCERNLSRTNWIIGSSWKMDVRLSGEMIRFMLGRPYEAVEGKVHVNRGNRDGGR